MDVSPTFVLNSPSTTAVGVNDPPNSILERRLLLETSISIN
jgi:hypothetical protein